MAAFWLAPVGIAVCKKINTMMLIVASGAALVVLVITLIAMPALLPISTSVFVIAVAVASAIAVAKGVRRAFKAK